jgi:hypothetical protein
VPVAAVVLSGSSPGTGPPESAPACPADGRSHAEPSTAAAAGEPLARTLRESGRGGHSLIPHASASCSRVNAGSSSPGPGSARIRPLATPESRRQATRRGRAMQRVLLRRVPQARALPGVSRYDRRHGGRPPAARPRRSADDRPGLRQQDPERPRQPACRCRIRLEDHQAAPLRGTAPGVAAGLAVGRHAHTGPHASRGQQDQDR